MTDRTIFIVYLAVTGLCAVYTLVHSAASKRSPRGRSAPRRVRTKSYLDTVVEVPMAVAISLIWPVAFLLYGLYLVLRALGVQPPSERKAK